MSLRRTSGWYYPALFLFFISTSYSRYSCIWFSLTNFHFLLFHLLTAQVLEKSFIQKLLACYTWWCLLFRAMYIRQWSPGGCLQNLKPERFLKFFLCQSIFRSSVLALDFTGSDTVGISGAAVVRMFKCSRITKTICDDRFRESAYYPSATATTLSELYSSCSRYMIKL